MRRRLAAAMVATILWVGCSAIQGCASAVLSAEEARAVRGGCTHDCKQEHFCDAQECNSVPCNTCSTGARNSYCNGSSIDPACAQPTDMQGCGVYIIANKCERQYFPGLGWYYACATGDDDEVTNHGCPRTTCD